MDPVVARLFRSCGLVLLAAALLLLLSGPHTVLAQAAPTSLCTVPPDGVNPGDIFTCTQSLGQGGTASTVTLSAGAVGDFALVGLSPTGTAACSSTTTISNNGGSGTVTCAANTGFFTGLLETFTIPASAVSGTALTTTVTCSPAASAVLGTTLTAGPGSCGNGTTTSATVTGMTSTGAAVTIGSPAQPSSTLISVSVDRGSGATYYAGEPITICVSLDFSGPNIYQASAFPVRLTDQVAGSTSVVIFRGLVAAAGQQCLTRAITAPFGSETITGEVFDPLNGTRIASDSVSFTSTARPNPSPPSVTLTPSASTASVGQSLTFTVAASATNPGATLQSVTLNFGDGSVLAVTPGASVSHSFMTAGTYSVTLTAVDSLGAAASTNATITVNPGAPPGPPGATVTFSPGWNLAAGPTGTVVTGNLGPLYTWQPGASVYATIPSGTPLSGGLGYWAYFNSTTTLVLPPAGARTVQRYVPASQWVLIGNPGTGVATVSGVGAVYVYDPTVGYTTTTTLQPGDGAWAYSSGGAVVTISSAGP